MSNKQQPASPQKESNDDKGKQDALKKAEPVKKPNEQPENPMKEQK
ncbi:hypothetical protein [Acinetobacter wanghuae]|nr:hypothetical protein [Acinetobacter wanghuae]